jgi:hypothetical protein
MRCTSLVWIGGLAACGEVLHGDPGLPRDGAASIDSTVTADGPPPDGAVLRSGSYGFEDLPQGAIPTLYTFGGGVTFTQPNPQPNDTQALIVTDCSVNSGFFGFSCANSKTAIPDGLKFLGSAGLKVEYPMIELTFAADITSFSVAFTASDGTANRPYTFTFLNAQNVQIATRTGGTIAYAGWATNKISFSDTTGFRRVQITGDPAIILDTVSWIAR